MATIAVLGTLDTKGHEHAYLADRIRARGHQALLIDVGTLAPPQIQPDIHRGRSQPPLPSISPPSSPAATAASASPP
jgi:uncharacterized protein (UPF0261 family)